MDRRTFLLLAGAGSALGATGLGTTGALAAVPHRRATAASASMPSSAIVPLRIIDIGGGALKVGIHIRLGGGAPRLYTFDTGSSGFYAAFNRDWWPSYKRIGGPQIFQSYGTEETFESKQVRTLVGIPTTTGELTVETEVGQVHDAYGGGLGPKPRSRWRKDTAAGRPPLFGHFFGDFGSGLAEDNGLFAVLPQLPRPLSDGFALRLGCNGIPSPTPTLEIGLTDDTLTAVTVWVPIRSGRPGSPPFPGSGLPTYQPHQINADFGIRYADAQYAFSTDAVLDTGGPTTDIHEAGAVKVPTSLLTSDGTHLVSGATFDVRAAGTTPGNGLDMSFLTGTVAGTDLVTTSASTGLPFVNLGLIPYFRYTVVFDIAGGRVGFAPCG